jgi:hypothetical protein
MDRGGNIKIEYRISNMEYRISNGKTILDSPVNPGNDGAVGFLGFELWALSF